MKRLMTTLVMIVLIGIGTDVANAQINWSGIARTERIRLTSRGRFPLIGGGRIGRIVGRIGGRIGGSRINWSGIARTEMIRHTSSRGRFPLIGRYGYGRGRNKVLDYVYSGMDLIGALGQNSRDDRLVDNQILTTNRMVSMDEREQTFRHEQSRVQNNENQELQQRIRMLELELQKLQLQQQAKK